MRPALLILSLCILLPTQAWAQNLPRPLYDRGPENTSIPASSTDAQTQPSGISWNQIQPNLGFGMTMSFTDTNFAQPGFGFWAGVKFLPWIDTWSPFGSLRLRIDSWQAAEGQPRDLLAVGRFGATWVQRPKKRYTSVMLAYMDIYGILGARIMDLSGDPTRTGSIRAGIGVGAPVFVPGSLFMLLNGVPLPNSVELLFDVQPRTGEVNALISLGIGL